MSSESTAPAERSDCRLFWEVYVPRLLARGRDTTLPALTADVRFQINGPGGGAWTVRARAGVIESVKPAEDERVDIAVSLSEEDFAGIARGSLDHQQAFYAGRIRIGGDVPLMLWIASLIPFLRERFPFRPEELRAERRSGVGGEAAEAEC